jgi:hypothetical protein
MIDRICHNAEAVIFLARKHLGHEVGFDRSGVQWLNSFVQQQYDKGTSPSEELVSALGSYLGECIIACFGGQWGQVNGVWCVKFDDRNVAYPFAKVVKQLEHGAEDSVLGFFDATPLVFQFPVTNDDRTAQ